MDDGGHRENGRLKAEQQHKAAQGQVMWKQFSEDGDLIRSEEVPHIKLFCSHVKFISNDTFSHVLF